MGRTGHGKIMFLLLVVCLVLIDGTIEERTLTNYEIRRHLKRLNKPAVTSIKSEDGDIIDCVNIYKQPALDHPLLKNHTIQMRPSNSNRQKITSLEPLEQLWQKSGSCREGTIPIRRTQKADLLRAGSLEGYGMKAASAGMESAVMQVDGINHGAAAYITIWSIIVEPGESSTSSIFVGKEGKPDLLNCGWIVSSKLYGDNATRLYGYFDSVNGGCYDLKCPGFVQTNNQIAFGGALTPVSTYNGEQRVLHVKIHKDLTNDHWWLDINFITIGYWPSSLLNNMADESDLVLWGGQVYNSVPGGVHTSTLMGSGNFPSEGFNKSSLVAGIVFLDKFNNEMPPSKYSMVATRPTCYDISGKTCNTKGLGDFFYYGGPGGPGCDE